MPMDALPDFATMSLTDVAKALAEKRMPPVENWHPAHCGDSEMRIARDGTWFHQGSPIGRIEMVRLFSTILRRQADGGYVLVTPGEKLDITVDDAPFNAVEVKNEGTGPNRSLAFRLNTGDLVVAGPEHGLRFEDRDDGPHPYLHVRGGLEALVARSVYYELAEMALEDSAEPLGLWSGGAFFPMTA
jgi:uncharacterized protein